MEADLWASVRALMPANEAIHQLSSDARSGETSALDFGAYFDLALLSPRDGRLDPEQKEGAIRYLAQRLRREPAALGTAGAALSAEPFHITNLSSAFYSDEQIERLIRWWDIEPGNSLALAAASPQELADARVWVPFAMQKLQDCAPDLHDEICVVVHEIVIARPDGSQQLDYGAASSFALWGALAVNAAAHDSWPRYYRTIVHEAAHLLLFGMARSEPLVTDSPEQRHSSPLRDDPRPMDGIFHAAFVSARESLAFDQLLSWHEEHGSLLPAEVEELEELLESSVIAFWKCDERLRGNSSLAGLGEAILAECESYMQENFQLLDH